MTIESGVPNPEQSTVPLVTEPQFDIFPNPNPSVYTTLTDTYAAMCADPQGFQKTLKDFAKRPFDLHPDFDWWPLIERGPNSYPLHLAFEFDEATSQAVFADEDYRTIKPQPGEDADDVTRRRRVRAFEIFLDRIITARGLGGASVIGAA